MKLHLLGLFHTVPTKAFSHCAFTNRIRTFPKMMHLYGYEVIEYSNEGSESEADVHEVILSTGEFENLKQLYREEQPNAVASVDSSLYRIFSKRLVDVLKHNVEPGDIICHPFGICHRDLAYKFPEAHHVEIGIGYTEAWADFRVYETYQWWAWHQGKEQKAGNAYQWVCPMAYDLDEWGFKKEVGDYLLYFGRVIECKGLQVVKEIAKRVPYEVRVVGEATPDFLSAFLADAPDNLTVYPPVTGTARSDLLGGARAMLMPTLYTEPFGGAGVEGQLCGTPLIASDFGAFAETVEHGVNGYRCKTLADWIKAIDCVPNLDRNLIIYMARNKYSLKSCGEQMDAVFRQIQQLNEGGWYSDKPTDAIWS